jgi:chromosome segregation ATPase
MTMMQEEKEKEVEELRTKMDEEKHAMESLQADIMSLKLQYQTASSSEAKLQEEIEKASQEKSVLFQKLEELQKFGEKTQTLLQASHSKELELVAELTALRAMNEKLEATLKEKYDENALLNSELYKSYREYEDVLNGFRDKMIERSKAESDQYSAETQEHFNEMMEQSILEQKGFEDFMNSLKPRKGWLMKQRPKGKKKFGKQRKRWFELKGDTLYWYKNRDDPSPQGY